jgi:arylsulfatase A-like enzyme
LPEGHYLDGMNLLPHLTAGKPLGKRELFWGHGDSRAMRFGSWKLVIGAPGQKQPGLFDLSQDPGEKNDLAGAEKERLESMLTAVKAWEIEVADAAAQPDSPPRDE